MTLRNKRNDDPGRKVDLEKSGDSTMSIQPTYEELPLPYHSMNEDGYILRVNRLWLSILGYGREEVIGRHFSDFLHPDWIGFFNENFPKYKADGKVSGAEFEMIRKDGASIWVSYHGNIVWERGCFKHTHCVFNDITAQKRVEEKILRERNFSDAALNSLPGIFYLFDQTGKFLRWNKNFEQVSEYSPEEIGRISPLDLFAGPDKLRAQERIQEAFEKGASSVEAGLVSKSGKQTPWYFTGHTIQFEDKTCIIGVGIDISERRQAESAIVESEKRYRLLSEQSIQGIAVFRGIPPVFSYVNPTWTRIFGYDSDEALSLNSEQIWNLVHPDDRDLVRERNRDRLLGRPADQRYEFRIIRKDGNIRWVEVFANIIEFGALPSSQALYVDITDRKRSEEERLGLATAVEHAADAIILTDKHGKIEYVNPATEKAIGFGREELVGHNFAILRSDQHDDAFYKTMWTRIASGQVWSSHQQNQRRQFV
jgi:PAS domain S-box-containing protein